MKSALYLILSALPFITTAGAPGYQQRYAPALESCVSVRPSSSGTRSFYNTCSTRIFVSVYGDGYHGLLFDGYYNPGHMDDMGPELRSASYRYFACPANASPVDTDGDEVSYSTRSYRCAVE